MTPKKAAKTPAKTKREKVSRKSLPYYEQPKLLERVMRVYEAYITGTLQTVIAQQERISVVTVWRDIQRAREVSLAIAADTIEGLREVAINKREALMRRVHLSLDGADEDDASGHASLLRELRENLKAIEELQHLRRQDEGTQPAAIVLFQVAAGAKPRTLRELSDEELLAAQAQLDAADEDIIEAQAVEVK